MAPIGVAADISSGIHAELLYFLDIAVVELRSTADEKVARARTMLSAFIWPMAERICFGTRSNHCGRAFDQSSASECHGWCRHTFTVRSFPIAAVEWELVRAFALGLTYLDSHLRFGVAINFQDEVTLHKFFDVKAEIGEIAWVLDEKAEIAGIIHRVGVSPSEAEIALIVRDDLRRRGIGEFLTRQMLSRAARQGFNTISASIFWNNRAALRLVSKIGYALRNTSTWTAEITFILGAVDAEEQQPLTSMSP